MGLTAAMPYVPSRPRGLVHDGPVGLGAIQGARIKGASQIAAVEPIAYRREAAALATVRQALQPLGAASLKYLMNNAAGAS